jgi:hypothetical protein
MSNQPTALTNSKRRFEKRIYTPLILADAADAEPSAVLSLAAMVRALMISDAEFTQLRNKVEGVAELTAVAAMQKLTTAVSASGVLAAATALAAVSKDDLRAVSTALGTIRSQATNRLKDGLYTLYTRYSRESAVLGSTVQAEVARVQPAAPAAPVPAPTVNISRAPLVAAAENVARAQASPTNSLPAASQSADLHMPATFAAASPRAAQLSLAAAMIREMPPSVTDRLLVATVEPQVASQIDNVMSWASLNAPDQLRSLATAAGSYLASSTDPNTAVVNTLTNLTRLQLLTQLFNDSLTQLPLQPLGLLHLERLEMTPLNIERGELTYSLPLAPNEKVTLAHREWAVREEQFSEFIEDQLENFSEQGVAQTNDIAMSTSTQTSHDNALSMSQPVASANGVHVTSPVDTTKSASSSVTDTTTKEESKSQSRTVTALASTRTMRDHKISFTVTTVSGMEDFTAHLIENKNEDKSMRIDYFKRVRNWQSDLYRYGVRLCYDVVLPDPGEELRQREEELQGIVAQLATEFQLDLQPSDITVNNWEQLADQYGVVLPAPPEQVQQIEQTQQVTYTTPYDVNTGGDGSKWIDNHRLVSLSVTVPQGSQLSNLNVYAQVQAWPDEPNPNGGTYQGWVNAYAGQSVTLAIRDNNGYCDIDWDLGPGQVPSEGQITVVFRMQLPESGLLKLTATAVPTESTMEEWRLASWSTIRDAAAANAAQHRTYLRDRQAALQKAIAGDDPVKLRRMEREAVMRAVLEWLFPGFEDANSVLVNLPSPGELDPGSWQQVMEYGEYIKFVQNSIDWDNVMVFLYPYFWDTYPHQSEKLFLDHPDPIHREFLRAGSARVIIAIEPGFEDQVVSLLDQGQLGSLTPKSRFAKVIKDVQDANAAYDKTTQGGGPSEDPKQPGILIGSWTDYTPSSALDIEVTLMSVISAKTK